MGQESRWVMVGVQRFGRGNGVSAVSAGVRTNVSREGRVLTEGLKAEYML